jgi:hypothetical protein
MTADGFTHGIWVWNTTTILSSGVEVCNLLADTQQLGFSNIYLYMAPSFYRQYGSALRNFISGATSAGMRVWGLDGDRTYLNDSAGPKDFYAGIDNLIAYNRSVRAEERFFGLQADIEPQDDGTHTSFHNDIADHALSTELGSGTWQSTQAQDRKMLMRSWISIHHRAQDMLHIQNLRFGAAMPFWTESYCGAEVQVSYPESTDTRQGVMKYMMPLLDEYIVMSYNTDPANAASRVAVQAAYAAMLPAESRPRVFGSMEVSTGVGANVSYGDTAGKNSRAVVMQDMEVMIATLRQHPAFEGIVFHHWSSWQVMPE